MGVSGKEESISIEVADCVQAIDSTSAKIIVGIIEELTKNADESFKGGHYLESAIIMFQLVEYFLRLIIELFGQINRLDKDILKKIANEQRFFNLVIFLGMVKPDNGISEKMFKLNRKRNDIVHHLFEFKSIEALKDELIAFHEESLNLIEDLRSLIPTKLNEMI